MSMSLTSRRWLSNHRPKDVAVDCKLVNCCVHHVSAARLALSLSLSLACRTSLVGLPLLLVGCDSGSRKDVAQTAGQTAVQVEESDGNADSVAAAAESSETSDSPPDSADWIRQIEAVVSGNTPTLQYSEPAGPLSDLLVAKKQIEDLLLDGGGTNDDAIGAISQLEELLHLRIRLDRLSDEAAATLVGTDQPTPVVETLQILNWPHSRLSTEGIRQLAKLKRLRQLRIGGELLDDEASKALAKLPALRSLHVIRPQFTADALHHLAAAPRLTSLYIDECPLPDEAWESLFAAKPTLHVHVDQAHHDLDPNSHP